MYVRVDWEHASLNNVRRIVESENGGGMFSGVAGDQYNNWIVFEVYGRLKFAKIKKIIQEIVWKINGGASVEVTEKTPDEVDDLM